MRKKVSIVFDTDGEKSKWGVKWCFLCRDGRWRWVKIVRKCEENVKILKGKPGREKIKNDFFR